MVSLAGRTGAAAIYVCFVTVEDTVGAAARDAEATNTHSVVTIGASGTVFTIGARGALGPTTIDVGFIAVEYAVLASGSIALPASAHAAFTVATIVTASTI